MVPGNYQKIQVSTLLTKAALLGKLECSSIVVGYSEPLTTHTSPASPLEYATVNTLDGISTHLTTKDLVPDLSLVGKVSL